MTTSLRSISFALFIAVISVAMIGPAFSQGPTSTPSERISQDVKAQIPGQVTVKKLPTAQIRPDLIRVNKRPPVAFQPFPMIDPKTRKQVSADYILTLPNGKKVKAGDYYLQLNKVEQEMNGLGYSLRTMPDNLVLEELVVDRTRLQRMPSMPGVGARRSAPAQLRNRFSGSYTSATGQRVPMASEITPETAAAVNSQLKGKTVTVVGNEVKIVPGSAPTMPAVPTLSGPTPKPKIVHREVPWNFPFGDEGFIQVYTDGKFVTDAKVYPVKDYHKLAAELATSNTEFSLSATGRAGAKILGQDAELVKITSSFNAPSNTSKPLNANIKLYFAGITVYNFNKSSPTKLTYADIPFSKSLKIPVVTWGLMFHGYGFGVEIGAKGSAGVKYGVVLDRAGVTGHVDPFVHTAVYGEGGLDVLIGGAKAVVNLTLLNADLQLYGTASFCFLLGKFLIFDDVYCDYVLDTLSGEFYVKVWVYYPCPKWTDPFDFCEDSWKKFKHSWEGKRWEGVLAEDKHIIAFDAW